MNGSKASVVAGTELESFKGFSCTHLAIRGLEQQWIETSGWPLMTQQPAKTH